jgi:hypothetical protein
MASRKSAKPPEQIDPGPSKKRRETISAPKGTSDLKYLEAAASAGRAVGQTCALKPNYLTDRSTSKAGKARLTGGKQQPVRTWLQDRGFDREANRFAFSCALCKSKEIDLKWDSILAHEDGKKHQEKEAAAAAEAASLAGGLFFFGADNVRQQEEQLLRDARARHDNGTLLEMAALFVLVS